jgi:hypothetical protein
MLSKERRREAADARLQMEDLKAEILAYEARRADLEAAHFGKFTLFHGGELIGTYETFDQAARDAVRRFGRGPYLIRQVGSSPITLPESVMYHLVYG